MLYKHLLIAGLTTIMNLDFVIPNEAQAIKFIVWNVGQGSWSTLISPAHCFHFDMGGEINPIRQVALRCKSKENQLIISHYDWDHISFAGRNLSKLHNLCLLNGPKQKSRNFKYLKNIPPCSKIDFSSELIALISAPLGKQLSENERSLIYSVAQRILVPGDSTTKLEKRWSSHIQKPKNIKILLLGHHGSNTSTSSLLLKTLPELKLTIASARYKKYRHPHSLVKKRVQAHGAALISTENWGHLHFEL